ncbi:exo-alpha-sialidase [Trypanosoma cruzi]|nr:exo-alpha-sialidase [Trypanosoma cruzi]
MGLLLLMDGHLRQKRELVVRKVLRHSLPHFANRPLCTCSGPFERQSIENPSPFFRWPMDSGVHAEVLIPPCVLREVTRQKANEPVSGFKRRIINPTLSR